jgi:hypothetical protein
LAHWHPAVGRCHHHLDEDNQMRFLMLALVTAFLTAPLVGCHEDTKTEKNPITGSTTTSHDVHGE